jgi:Lon protease-like protein
VYEARYLTMMRELQTASTARVEAKFGHILAPSSAPPVLMQDSIGGYPPIGVCAGVKSFQEFPNGRLQVGLLLLVAQQ